MVLCKLKKTKDFKKCFAFYLFLKRIKNKHTGVAQFPHFICNLKLNTQMQFKQLEQCWVLCENSLHGQGSPFLIIAFSFFSCQRFLCGKCKTVLEVFIMGTDNVNIPGRRDLRGLLITMFAILQCPILSSLLKYLIGLKLRLYL